MYKRREKPSVGSRVRTLHGPAFHAGVVLALFPGDDGRVLVQFDGEDMSREVSWDILVLEGTSRWEVLEGQTSPSGKRLFRCLDCRRVSVTPDKICSVGCFDP